MHGVFKRRKNFGICLLFAFPGGEGCSPADTTLAPADPAGQGNRAWLKHGLNMVHDLNMKDEHDRWIIWIMILHSIADCRAMTWICHWIKLIIFNYPTHRVSPSWSCLFLATGHGVPWQCWKMATSHLRLARCIPTAFWRGATAFYIPDMLITQQPWGYSRI